MVNGPPVRDRKKTGPVAKVITLPIAANWPGTICKVRGTNQEARTPITPISIGEHAVMIGDMSWSVSRNRSV